MICFKCMSKESIIKDLDERLKKRILEVNNLEKKLEKIEALFEDNKAFLNYSFKHDLKEILGEKP